MHLDPGLLYQSRFKQFLVLVIIIFRTDPVQNSMMCPVPEPCYCMGDDVIYCAFQRLVEPPYFLEFYGVWDLLNLSDNLMKTLGSKQFNGIKINVLDLKRNLLRYLSADSFYGIQSLKTLDLSHNMISNFPNKIFSPLKKLTCLKVKYNRFTYFHPESFRDLQGLQELDISGNDLTTFPTQATALLKNLKKLFIRGNQIKVLGANVIPKLPLDILDLGYNLAPFRVNPEAFCNLRPVVSHTERMVKEWAGIKSLILDHNGMSNLDPCVIKFLWTLQKIDLSGNPLNCDCRLYFLKVWGTRTLFPNSQCASPYSHAGEYFNNLRTHTYNCTQDDVPRKCDMLCHKENNSHNGSKSNIFISKPFLFLWILYQTHFLIAQIVCMFIDYSIMAADFL